MLLVFTPRFPGNFYTTRDGERVAKKPPPLGEGKMAGDPEAEFTRWVLRDSGWLRFFPRKTLFWEREANFPPFLPAKAGTGIFAH